MINTVLKLALAIGLLAAAGPLSATEIPVPTQTEWAAVKKTVDLPNGMKLAYSEMGDVEGMPLLLIHGYTDNSRSWSLLAPYLKNRHVYAIDLRGHGKSSARNAATPWRSIRPIIKRQSTSNSGSSSMSIGPLYRLIK